MPRKQPAVEKAFAFVQDYLEEYQEQCRVAIPGAHALADAAGVSYVSMRKAIAALKELGVLTNEARPRLAEDARVDADDHVPPVSAPARKWQRVADRLQGEAMRGGFGPDGVLPPLKELCDSQGASHRTMRAAIDSLVREGVLIPYKRTVRVATAARRARRATLVLVTRSAGWGSIFLYRVRTWEYLRLLETECARRGIALETATFDFRGEGRQRLDKRRLDQIVASSPVLGFLVPTMGLARPFAPQLVRELAVHGKPISLLDDTEMRWRGMHLGEYGAAHIQVALGRRAGADVGRYLLSLGHRRVAYINTFGGSGWAAGRFEGLERVYRAAGKGFTVMQYTVPSAPPRPTITTDNRSLRRVYQSEPMANISAQEEEEMARLANRARPQLEQAVASKGVTAMVACNDSVGLACLEFLRGRGVRVPRDVSVIGFDDTLDAMRVRLTSYNFNNHGAVHAAMAHILNPRAWPRGHRSRPVRITGFVTERETSGGVKRQ